MKKLTLITALAVVAMMFTSCRKDDYTQFVGTWGVEKIEYYNVDYAGNPIAGSLSTYTYDPNDVGNGIQLVFKKDKTGEMRDSAIDTIWIDYNEETATYDSYIVNPDTTLIYPFTYSYDNKERVLYMNMDYGTELRTFRMYIKDLSDDSFVYENEYDKDYMEKGYLKRISDKTTKSGSRQATKHPHKRGALMGDR